METLIRLSSRLDYREPEKFLGKWALYWEARWNDARIRLAQVQLGVRELHPPDPQYPAGRVPCY